MALTAGYFGGNVQTSSNFSIKLEPQSPASSVSSSTSSMSSNRKRNASEASLTQMGDSSRKLKKYEMDPSDPSVRNAIAAKANREKKKQEHERFKIENEKLKQENAELKKRNEAVVLEKDMLVDQLAMKNAEVESYLRTFREWEQVLGPLAAANQIKLEEPSPSFNSYPESPQMPPADSPHQPCFLQPDVVAEYFHVVEQRNGYPISPEPDTNHDGTVEAENRNNPVWGTPKWEEPTLGPYDECFLDLYSKLQ